MFRRLITPSNDNSFFIFGSRGTGKTTWLKQHFSQIPHLWLDLLDTELETELSLNPASLKARINSLNPKTQWVVIDEIQKIPALLNTVHQQIEEKKLKFALTGSSARKLKRGAANLLAGRAFVYHLYPLTTLEITSKQKINLNDLLMFGSLPKIFHLPGNKNKIDYLRAYTQTYLSEEIVAEQLVRNLLPFRRFLPVAAQANTQIINYSKTARDIGVNDKTVQSYYEILEDTHIGFRLYPFVSSFRKRLSQKPKFYFFDTGVTRTLARFIDVPLIPQTSAYGDAFEHFIILEAKRLCSIYYPDYELTYLKTKDQAEIDLVIDRPGKPILLIEIKSTTSINSSQLTTLENLSNDLTGSEAYCLSQDPAEKQFNNITCLPWSKGLKTLFTR